MAVSLILILVECLISSFFLRPEADLGIPCRGLRLCRPDKEDESKVQTRKSENEIHWVRPLGYAEKFMTSAAEMGNMTTLYAVWIESKKTITIHDIKEISKLMYRKMPHLQLSVGKINGEFWWKTMTSELQDVEEINKTNEDVPDLFKVLSKHKYDIEKGPLWFVRFVLTSSMPGNASDMCKYILIFGFHHNFSDGSTNVVFCNNFILCLNSYFDRSESHIIECGYFAYPIHEKISNENRNDIQLIQYFAKRFCSGLLSFNKTIKSFLRAYPLPYNNTSYAQTNVQFAELEENTTIKLLKRCKKEGVTLNSAFTAAANIGLYKMILLKDKNLDKITFYTQHAINMRRYWPKDKQKLSLGCHISMANINIPTDIKDIENFWEYSRTIHKIINQELKTEQTALKMQPLSETLWLVVLANQFLDQIKWPSANDSHYCVTNMGDISSFIQGGNKIVNITKLHRSVAGHYMQGLCQHTLQTFKGKLYYSMDFYSQKMTPQTAQVYLSFILDIIQTEIVKPN